MKFQTGSALMTGDETMKIADNLNNGEYVYLGDRNTDTNLKGGLCSAVRRADGKCIRGKNGSMLVSFGENKMVVVGRLLRKVSNGQLPNPKIQNSNSKTQKSKLKVGD